MLEEGSHKMELSSEALSICRLEQEIVPMGRQLLELPLKGQPLELPRVRQ